MRRSDKLENNGNESSEVMQKIVITVISQFNRLHLGEERQTKQADILCIIQFHMHRDGNEEGTEVEYAKSSRNMQERCRE